jgi:hypothetical protein
VSQQLALLRHAPPEVDVVLLTLCFRAGEQQVQPPQPVHAGAFGPLASAERR